MPSALGKRIGAIAYLRVCLRAMTEAAEIHHDLEPDYRRWTAHR